MYKLVVLCALVAVSVAAPSGLISPYGYLTPHQTLVQSVPSVAVVKSAALIGSVPTSVSSQSSTVVHGSGPFVSSPVVQYSAPAIQYSAPAVQYSAPAVELINLAPVVETHAVVGSVPTSVSSHSSTVVHDARPVVSTSVVAAPAVQVVNTQPIVEVARSIPTVQVYNRDIELLQPARYIASVPSSVSSQSSSVVHSASPLVSAYSPVVVRQSPAVQYSEPLVQYAPVAQAAPVLQYAAAPLSSYSTHGIINSAGYLASPAVVQDW